MATMKMNKKSARQVRRDVALQIVAIVVSLVYLVLLFWMISTSLKESTQVFTNPPQWLPNPVVWENYVEAVTTIDYLRYSGNTLIISVTSMIGSMLSASMVAFSITKIDWVGKKLIFPLVLASMMLPYQVTMIPVYIIWRDLGLTGTYLPLIIPYFLGSSYYVFLLRQFSMTVPNALFEAATIDGASEGRQYVSIMLPLIKPAITSVGIFTFLGSWSDFLGPLIYINNERNYTLTLGLYAFVSEHSVDWHLLMAASVVFVIPVIIIFFFAQKQFIEGITLTGIKG